MASRKDDLNKYLAFLQDLIEDLNENQARNGKNKNIRDKETAKISDAVSKLERYLQNNKGLADLLLEYHGGNAYSYDETLSFKYLLRDVSRLIYFIKEKLAEV